MMLIQYGLFNVFILCKYVTNKGTHKTAAISFFVAIEVRKQKAVLDVVLCSLSASLHVL